MQAPFLLWDHVHPKGSPAPWPGSSPAKCTPQAARGLASVSYVSPPCYIQVKYTITDLHTAIQQMHRLLQISLCVLSHYHLVRADSAIKAIILILGNTGTGVLFHIAECIAHENLLRSPSMNERRRFSIVFIVCIEFIRSGYFFFRGRHLLKMLTEQCSAESTENVTPCLYWHWMWFVWTWYGRCDFRTRH